MTLCPTIINDFINVTKEHFTMTDQTVNYEFDEEAASHADDFANRINENGMYIGQFTKAEDVTSAEKGTKGVYFEFECPGGGKTNFTLYTKKASGEVINVGMNKLQAIMLILGIKSGLRAVAGKVSKYNNDTNEREEVDGLVFPDLLGKDIGIVMQKELYTGNDGKDRDRMGLLMTFHPGTKLSASEIRERKAKPEKLEKTLKTLKTIDKREKRAAEPSQPAVGAPAGEY